MATNISKKEWDGINKSLAIASTKRSLVLNGYILENEKGTLTARSANVEGYVIVKTDIQADFINPIYISRDVKFTGDVAIIDDTVVSSNGMTVSNADVIVEYPVSPENGDWKYNIVSYPKYDMLKRTLSYASTDMTRPVLNALYFNAKNKTVDVANGFQLLRIPWDVETDCLLPLGIAKWLVTNKAVRISLHKAEVGQHFDGCVVCDMHGFRVYLYHLCISGTFPNVDSIIPKPQGEEKAYLVSPASLGNVLSSIPKDKMLFIDIKDGVMSLDLRAVRADEDTINKIKFNARVACGGNLTRAQFCVNGTMLKNIMESLDGYATVMMFFMNRNQVVMFETDDKQIVALVMPMSGDMEWFHN